MSDSPSPLDTALDLLVYVPVGLAVTAAEELPKLAAKGRNRVGSQIGMARVLGQFAVAQGRQQIARRWNFSPAASTDSSPPAEGRPDTAAGAAEPSGSHAYAAGFPDDGLSPLSGDSAPAAPASQSAQSTQSAQSAQSKPAPPAQELAIPGYDSLSASQVVQRLAGLAPDELSAVARYEQAHRARRTILNRVHQLQQGL